MQELFADKFHFFKFLSMSNKPRLHQLKVIISSHSSTIQASLTVWMFSSVPAKFSSVQVSLVFRKFSHRTYRNGLNRVPQSWGTPSISKSLNRVSSIPFVRNPHFNILLHRVWHLKNLFMSRRTGHHFPGWV